ncbi:hypothetical protein ACFQY5_14980 [Paeniroseomonas aquatica]|uniref:hypothetical protein n=1 Tax=Paeniroseomonas aquatica TaxID=373043 RepID=UPI003610D840
MSPEPFRLTDLTEQPPGLRRAVHGYSTAGTWRRLARRVAEVGLEVAAALPRDAWRRRFPGPSPLLRLEAGEDPRPGARSVALYVHYAASGRVSALVLEQLRLLAAAGFAVVFISNAPGLPAADWEAVRAVAALVVQRRNLGLDFGAWRDLAPEARRRWPAAGELLLANDSVLGPIRPFGPMLASLRDGGPGLFGLTESIQGGPHLQSYFLLTRGAAAVADLHHFLAAMRVSHSKWLVVQRGSCASPAGCGRAGTGWRRCSATAGWWRRPWQTRPSGRSSPPPTRCCTTWRRWRPRRGRRGCASSR